MNCLVTGGCGFLGSNLLVALHRSGERVRCLDIQRAPILPEAVEGCEFQVGDLTRASDLAEALNGIEVVYHLAAPFFIPEGQRQPALDVERNLAGGVKLLAACADAGVRRVVFPSSGGAVYGPSAPPRPLRESDRPQPTVSYGIVKLALEGYLAMFHAARGLEFAALRVSNPYGPGQAPHRGQGVVATLLECARSGAPFELLAPRTTIRDYVYVEDVAAALVAAGRWPGAIAEVLNVGSGHGVDLQGLIAAVEATTGKQVRTIERPPRSFDVPINVLDCTLVRERLGWQATTSLADGLAKTWAWIQARGSQV